MYRNVLRTISMLLVLCVAVVGCSLVDRSGPVCVEDYQQTIRVACVGDSITYGSAIKNRLRDCYPARLGRMLGEKWQTRNFGVGGATMLKKGDVSYWTKDAFEDAMAYNPHVVIIKLGTNDSKSQNWKYKNEFADDYREMIDRFASLPTRPRIWVCLPVQAYSQRWKISNSVITDELIAVVRQVAKEKKVPVIDLYKPLSGKPHLFPDTIHPNAEGAELMAKVIYKALTGKEAVVR